MSMPTYEQVLRQAKKAARARKMETAAIELLMLEFSGLSPTELYLAYNDEMPEIHQTRFQSALSQYLDQGIPVQYIIGHVYFFGYQLKVNEDVLIPRYETEELVERTLILYDRIFGESPVDVIDIGTGSGCIAIALKLEAPNMRMHATDISSRALAVARMNANLLHADVLFREGDLFQAFGDQKFDIIVSNPPYIPIDEEVAAIIHDHEPHVALYGGQDGLHFYRKILDEARHHVKDRFVIAFEHAFDKGDRLREYATSCFPLAAIITEKDMQDKERMTFIIRE